MTTAKTLNQIIAELEAWASSHLQVHSFGQGDIWEVSPSSSAFTFPLMWVTPSTAEPRQNELVEQFNVIVCDLVDNGEANELEVLSDTRQILKDLVSWYRQQHSSAYIVEFQGAITPFTERFAERVSGNALTIRLRQPDDYDECAIPLGTPIPAPPFCAPATYTLNDTSTPPNQLSTGSIPSGGSAVIVAPDATVLRDGQPFGSVPSGGSIDVPSDCGVSVTVTVTLSDDTPRMDDVVTVTASATGITATSYTFYLPKCQGYEAITQASPTLNWPVRVYGTFEVVVTATDGVSEGVGSVSGVTSGDVNADAFIAAHEAATGLTMGNVQRAAVLNACLGLKGSGLAGYTDYLWDSLATAGARWAMYCPVSDSVANADAYSVELFDPSTLLTLVGFVPADITVNGMIGGTGKYLRMGVAPDQFPQDNQFALVYNRTETPPANGAMYGSCSFQNDIFTSANNASAITTATSTRLNFWLNSGRQSFGNYAVAPAVKRQVGVNAVTRTSSISQQLWIDNGIRKVQAENTDEWSYTPSDEEYYVHAANSPTGQHRSTTAQLCGFMCGPCDNLRAFDQIKAVFTRFQQEVITGGRNV